MKKLLPAALIAVSLVWGGCEQKHENDVGPDPESSALFTLSSDIGADVGLYLFDGSLDGGCLLDNEPFTADGGVLVGKNGLSFVGRPSGKVTVVAYAPYDASLAGLGAPVLWSLPTDYTQPGAFDRGEWLYAQGRADDLGAAIPLAFGRLTASVVIRVELTGFAADAPHEIGVVLEDQPSEAQVDLREGKIVSTQAATQLVMQTADGTASACVLPQTMTQERAFAVVTVDGVEYPVRPSADLTVEPGCRYTWRVVIEPERGVIESRMEINDWIPDSESTIDPDVEQDNTLTDIDGNEYGFVEIGNYLWQAQNLRVTRLNDGTPITFVDASSSVPFHEQTEPAHCVFDHQPIGENPHSVLYNFHAVETGKLCPEGWHVPSYDEWLEMAAVFGGVDVAGEALKSETGWLNDGNGTNASGLNFLPVGVCESSFKQLGKFTYVWSSTPIENKTTIYVGNLSYSNNTLKFWSWGSAKNRGYSVRCVKKIN